MRQKQNIFQEPFLNLYFKDKLGISVCNKEIHFYGLADISQDYCEVGVQLIHFSPGKVFDSKGVKDVRDEIF